MHDIGARQMQCASWVLAAAFLLGAPAGLAEEAFYEAAPGELRGRPGTIIRAEPFGGAPHGASAMKILYRSTGLRGEPIAVSGIVVTPPGPAPAGGRPVVAWAHPTTGVARHCAPSLSPHALQWIPGLDAMLAHGYVVSATDYPGLGTAGVHPYVIGESEGRAVLDSVRAARALPGTGAGDRFALWGHSQGGHAALFAGQLARRYAPELKLVGIAAAAPATELGELFHADIKGPAGEVLGSYALWAWSKIYNLPLDNVLVPTAPLVFERLVKHCNDSARGDLSLAFATQPLLREGFLKVDITKVDPWRRLMRENTPGGAAAGGPLFLAQGSADPVVRPHVTAEFMRVVCGRGTPVRFVNVPGGDHSASARYGAAPAVEWIAARFAGAPPPNDC
jgi:alpha-beta hydrolase superfamily lysophospholipase